jgi:hypothetical protein
MNDSGANLPYGLVNVAFAPESYTSCSAWCNLEYFRSEMIRFRRISCRRRKKGEKSEKDEKNVAFSEYMW